MALFPVKSYLPGTLVQDLVEAGKEGNGRNGRCQNITDRLGEKDAEALICREAGQDKNQWDQQDDLPQTGQQEADFGLTQRHKALLAGDLNISQPVKETMLSIAIKKIQILFIAYFIFMY